MEFLEGETLAVRLATGALPLARALATAVEIADALAAAHRAGIAHRDLKPGNIMLTRTGAKLLDFGLAKVTPAAVAASGLSMAPTGVTPVTAQGTILGTLQYMAPEQVEGHEADSRSDIFAFGAIVYEMVTGKRAFDGKSQASVIAAILEREPPTLSALQPLTPRMLDRIVAKCLAKEPDQRWQAVSDVRDELIWIAQDGTDVATKAVAKSGGTLKSWLVTAAIVAAAVVATGMVSAEYFRRPEPDEAPVRFGIEPQDKAVLSSTFPFVAIAPDGRKLVYVANIPPGRTQLWLHTLAAGTAQPLAGTENSTQPFWSPDSQYIGFFAEGQLKKIAASGGPPQVVAEKPFAPGLPD